MLNGFLQKLVLFIVWDIVGLVFHGTFMIIISFNFQANF